MSDAYGLGCEGPSVSHAIDVCWQSFIRAARVRKQVSEGI